MERLLSSNPNSDSAVETNSLGHQLPWGAVLLAECFLVFIIHLSSKAWKFSCGGSALSLKDPVVLPDVQVSHTYEAVPDPERPSSPAIVASSD